MKRFVATVLIALSTVGAGSASAEGERIVFVGHWPLSDAFFNVIRNSSQLAADQMGVTVEFLNPTDGDLSEMARLIDQAAASSPDAIIATIPDISVVGGPLSSAVDSGISVAIVNSGSGELARQIGALVYIGQAEYDAGYAAGAAAKDAGAKRFVCVNHFFAHQASRDRCNGFADGLGVPLGNQEIDSGTDPNDVRNRTAAFLSAHPDTDAILTLGPTGAAPVITYLNEQGSADRLFFATFDLSEEIVLGMQNGVVDIAIDQQPFIQGYQAVQTLTNYLRYGVLAPNDIASGPGIVNLDNLDIVLSLAGQYR